MFLYVTLSLLCSLACWGTVKERPVGVVLAASGVIVLVCACMVNPSLGACP
jgi:hypothetical protein